MAEHLKPCIRITPFSSNRLNNAETGNSTTIAINPEFWLDEGIDISFLNSGRDALKAALYDIGLSHHDNVLIITTSQGPYISSCVTNAIDSICHWTRLVDKQTRAILVIHEFGFPCSIPSDIQSMGLPIIEDCAYATGTRVLGSSVGRYGDYAIYSIPKYFPLPFGGLAVSRTKMHPMNKNLQISEGGIQFIKTHLMNMMFQCDAWNKVRKSNWLFFQKRLEPFGMKPYYGIQENISPGVYVLRLPVEHQNIGGKLKQLSVNAGIEATEYYGQCGFYFPVHQYLSDFEKQLICYQFEKGVVS